MDIYDKIDELLKERSISRRKLAIDIGVPPSTFHSMMTNKTAISAETLFKICDYLGVPIQVFNNVIDFNDEKRPNNNLKEKLSHIGYTLTYDSEICCYWIGYPDGEFLVDDYTIKDVDALNDSADDYLKFKLDELKKKYPNSFQKRTSVEEDFGELFDNSDDSKK